MYGIHTVHIALMFSLSLYTFVSSGEKKKEVRIIPISDRQDIGESVANKETKNKIKFDNETGLTGTLVLCN